MIDIVMYISCICLGYILSNQVVPLEEFKVYIDNWFKKRVIYRKKWFQKLKYYVSHLFNCSSCISFWIVLFVFGDIWLAFIAYVVAGYISTHLNRVMF